MFKLLIRHRIKLGGRLALLAVLILPFLAQPLPAAAGPAKPGDTFLAYLPLIWGPLRGITGAVTNAGQPAAAVETKLLRYNPQEDNWSIIFDLQTDNTGKYLFSDVPSLLPNQKYQVQYVGSSNINLQSWTTPALTSYLSNTLVTMETFDIAGINHVAPTDSTSVTLPYDFQWTTRPATPQDHYSVTFFGPVQFNGADVGYSGSYTLQSLPPGAPFGPSHSYLWKVAINWPDGSIGYENLSSASQVYFNNSGAGFGRLPTLP